MKSGRISRIFNHGKLQAKLAAGNTLAADSPAYLGDPTSNKIYVNRKEQPRLMYVHQRGEQGISIFTAINNGLNRDEKIMRAPIKINKSDGNKLYITGTDPDYFSDFVKGAATGEGQMAVNIGQLLYSTIQPDIPFDGVRYVVTGAAYADDLFALKISPDFVTSPNDASGSPINIPTASGTCNVVLVVYDTLSSDLLYYQTGEITDNDSLSGMYNAGILPTATIPDEYRIGYIKLAANKTQAEYNDVLHMPDFIRHSNTSSLIIEEEDGTPTGAPDILKFTNNTLTDNGGGIFSVNVPYVFGDLSDVNFSGSPAGAGSVISYDIGNGTWSAFDISNILTNLSQVGDVESVTPSDGDLLQYSSTASEWQPVNISTIRALDLSIFNARMTLTSGDPEDKSTSSSGNLYLTPYNGNRVVLYDGSDWQIYTFTEITQSLSGLSASTVYDVYIYDNAGTITLEFVAWTNDTTRATALAYQDGVKVKSTDATRRFVGIIRTDSSTQLSVNLTDLQVANADNRLPHTMQKILGATHSYNGGYRAWNNDTGNRLNVLSLAPEQVEVNLIATAASATGGTTRVGLGLNRSNGSDILSPATTNFTTNDRRTITDNLSPDSGYNFYQVVQQSDSGASFANYFLNITTRF